MSTPILLAVLLALAVLLGTLQAWRRSRHPAARALRCGLLLGSAAGLWYLIFPPLQPLPGVVLRVHTAAAPAVDPASAAVIDIALPEAPAHAPGARVPDLATAQRRWPHAQALEVVGAGLPQRDHAAALGLPVHWTAAAPPSGLRALHAPHQAIAGSPWRIHACWEGPPPAALVLRDPAGRIADQAPLDTQGCARLVQPAPAPGLSLWSLEAMPANGMPTPLVSLPLQSLPGTASRLLLLGGAPGPEWKYLRRWALDAGLQVRAGFALGAGMRLGDPLVLPQDLDAVDVLVLDERALTALGAPGRRRLQEAMHAGLGVLLRLSGPLDPAAQAWARELGLRYQPAELDPELPWPLPVDPGTSASKPPPLILHRRPLRMDGALALPLLSTPSGDTVGVWTPVGQGSLGALWLNDSFRLHLAGPPGAHAGLWHAVLQPLLRRSGAAPWQIETPLWADQRTRICGLPAAMQWRTPAGTRWPLAVHTTTAGTCAEIWPTAAGWHQVETPDGSQSQPVYVHPAEAAPTLRAQQLRTATLGLVHASPRLAPVSTATQPGPAWPWALLWLLCSAGLAWIECRDRRAAA